MKPRDDTRRARPLGGKITVAALMFIAVVAALTSPVEAVNAELSGWVLDSDGSVKAFGTVPDLGDSPGPGIAVSLVANSSNDGYWVLWASGRVTAHGNAVHHGDLANFALNRPAISMSILPSEGGYVILAADGGVFAFGSAQFHGSVPGVSLAAARDTTAVAIQLTSAGYRIIHDDGGVFAFGNAPFKGSIPGVLRGASLDQPVVDAVAGANGETYAMVAADGGVFAFGLSFSGSLGGSGRTDIVGAADDRSGGYVLVDTSGTVYWFGDNQRSLIQVPGILVAADIAIATTDVAQQASTTTSTTSTTTTTSTTIAPTTTTIAPTTTTTTTTSTTIAPTTTTTTTTTAPGPTTTTTTGLAPVEAVTIWTPHSESAGPDNYFVPAFIDQGNWLGPNLTVGDAVLTIEITAKPTSLPVDIQVCAWTYINGRNFEDGFHETCSPSSRFSDETAGPVVVNLGAPNIWWQKNDEFPWTDGPDLMRLIIKDAASHSLMMATSCGTFCYSGEGLVDPHVPIAITASLTFNN